MWTSKKNRAEEIEIISAKDIMGGLPTVEQPPKNKREVSLVNWQIGFCVLWVALVLALRMFFGHDALKNVYQEYAAGGFELTAGEHFSRLAGASISAIQDGISNFASKLDVFANDETGAANGGVSGSIENDNNANLQENSVNSASNAPQSETDDVNISVSASVLTGQGGPALSVKEKEGALAVPENATTGRYTLSDLPLLPVQGVVTSKYGFRDSPITGEYEFHTGLDIAADEGTPIRAAFGGVVVETGVSATGGNYVKLQHGEVVNTYYYHMLQVYVFTGQKIARGQVVGCVGQTGQATGNHLHFEIKINGINVDPYPALEYAL